MGPSMAFARTLRHQPLGVIGVLLLVLFVTIAVLAPAITPYDPAAIDLDRWKIFETENPDTFSSMYQFWIQKPG